MKYIIKNFIQKIKKILNFKKKRYEEDLVLRGKILIDTIKNKTPIEINDIELKIFSQFGDDGIIQYLINKLEIEEKYFNFIEFGVENYLESNTRFLLINNNWSGLILDASEKNIHQIKNSSFFWKHDLEAKSCFINKSNINNILLESKLDKNNIGILSIDIDGNDYWILKEIYSFVKPEIIILEYNASFLDKSISVPYHDNFERHSFHKSGFYHGASINAFYKLLSEDYFLIESIGGNNLIFLRKDKLKNDIKTLTPNKANKEPLLRNKWSGKKAKEQWEEIKCLDYIEI